MAFDQVFSNRVVIFDLRERVRCTSPWISWEHRLRDFVRKIWILLIR